MLYEVITMELSDKLMTDPVVLAGYLDARNVLMYIAAFDRIVDEVEDRGAQRSARGSQGHDNHLLSFEHKRHGGKVV